MAVKKADGEKLRYDLVPVDALRSTVEVLTHGARKYSDHNWAKGTNWGRYYAALQRHLQAWWAGEDWDQESGMSHLAHAAYCLMFLQAYEARGIGTDDRMKL